jgi:type IV pilus assembly protein PilM
MNGTMAILREYNWQQVVRTAKGILGRVSLATGVDIGSSFMKTVVLQADHHGLSLADFSMQSVVETAYPDEQSYAGLVESIREKIMIPLGTIGTSLSGPSVFVKSITLPVMTEEDLREHLALELDRYIAFDVQDVFWDVYCPKPFREATGEQQEHFLVVAKKECVERCVDAFRQYGMTLRFVDVDAFALVNMVTYNYGRKGSWLLAHIGPTGTIMVVIVEGKPACIRKVSYEAEWYGDFLDQVLIGQTSSESRRELGTSETLLLEQFFQETRGQICETLESFSDLSRKVIDRGILLSGGYVVSPEMASTLAQSFGMPVNLLDPFQSITVPQAIQQDSTFQQAAPLMSIAVSVALRGAALHD